MYRRLYRWAPTVCAGAGNASCVASFRTASRIEPDPISLHFFASLRFQHHRELNLIPFLTDSCWLAFALAGTNARAYAYCHETAYFHGPQTCSAEHPSLPVLVSLSRRCSITSRVENRSTIFS